MAELDRLTWPEARDAFRSASVGILPVGATEQHGPHLPLCTDRIIAEAVARPVAERSDVLLLPPIAVGVSHEHIQFWGTLAIPPDELRDLVLSVVRSCAEHGLRRFVLANGHGPNGAPLEEAARLLRRDGVATYVFSWWQAAAATLSSLGLSAMDHAGPVETSLLLAIDHRLVRSDRISQASSRSEWGVYVEQVQVEFDAVRFTAPGNIGDPRLASADKGEAILRDATAALSRFCDWLTRQAVDSAEPARHLS